MTFQHEWAAHGTCYDTLEPSCLPPGSPTGAEAVAFFERTVALFRNLPTYSWLASQGITPSHTETYTLSQLNDALRAASGVRYHAASPMTRHHTNYVYTVHPKPWLPQINGQFHYLVFQPSRFPS
jgi:hypothetical protein